MKGNLRDVVIKILLTATMIAVMASCSNRVGNTLNSIVSKVPFAMYFGQTVHRTQTGYEFYFCPGGIMQRDNNDNWKRCMPKYHSPVYR